MLFTPASLHKICTKALLGTSWYQDGYYFNGNVALGAYRISTYHDFCHKRRDELSPRELLKRGESLISIQIPEAHKDVLVLHPRNLMTQGNFAQRSYMECLVEIYRKQPDLNTPVVYDPSVPRLASPAKDPWLQSIFEDLKKRVG